MATPTCTDLMGRMAQWGAEYIYNHFGLKDAPPACSTAVIYRDSIMLWQKYNRLADLPRKVVDIRSGGDVVIKDDCEYNEGNSPETAVRKTWPGCKPTDWQKIGSVNPNKLKEFIRITLPPDKSFIQFYVNQPPAKPAPKKTD